MGILVCWKQSLLAPCHHLNITKKLNIHMDAIFFSLIGKFLSIWMLSWHKDTVNQLIIIVNLLGISGVYWSFFYGINWILWHSIIFCCGSLFCLIVLIKVCWIHEGDDDEWCNYIVEKDREIQIVNSSKCYDGGIVLCSGEMITAGKVRFFYFFILFLFILILIFFFLSILFVCSFYQIKSDLTLPIFSCLYSEYSTGLQCDCELLIVLRNFNIC